ncbi:hypothetical protein TNCV_3797011 [Trichonephila clavipes]|nr:hypothetical protein TNCV_3797011 [Trichonephila clavipes]
MTSLRRTQRPNACHLPFHIPRGRGNYPFPLAGVNGPSHSYRYCQTLCKRVANLLTDHHKGQRMGAALTFLEAYGRHEAWRASDCHNKL